MTSPFHNERDAPTLVTRLGALLAGLAAARRARRNAERLRGGSDHALSDVGLARGDLDRTPASPVWVNPADRLLRWW